MNALYRFTQLTDSVTTFISFQHDSSCLHLLIHTGFLGWLIQMNQLHISTRRDLTAILDHLHVRCTASLLRAAARAGVTQAPILFQAFGWWRAGKKLGRRQKIDEGKNSAFFRLVFLFALVAYDLTCSPLSKRLEQANKLPALSLRDSGRCRCEGSLRSCPLPIIPLSQRNKEAKKKNNA